MKLFYSTDNFKEIKMESINFFQEEFKTMVLSGVKNISLEIGEVPENEKSLERTWESQNTNNMSCSYCQIAFPDVAVQREHYKLDWHRFNLKQSLIGRNSINEQEFETKNKNDDLSSISGSDSEKEDTLDTFANTQGKLFVQNTDGKILSFYKCLLFKKKDEIDDKILFDRLKHSCESERKWMILMLGGGHFAGAIFDNTEPILHKTFHCYTVRQGQGGSQSSRDNKSGGSHPKSAGASLRRYNEQALIQHVQNFVKQWEKEKYDMVFYRAPGPHNQSVLFSGANPILERSDKRVRPIPFSTRRATFAEVKRVHGLLSTIEVYDNLEAAVRKLDKHRQQNRESKRKTIRSPQINRAKSREIVERPLPTKHSSETNSIVNSDSDEEEIDENTPLNICENEISFDHLNEFECTEKKRGKKKKPKKSKAKKLQEQEDARKKELIDILVMGNLLKLKEKIEMIGEDILENKLNIVEDLRVNFVNEVLDEDGNSFLHLAALNEHSELVKFLLENSSDPCLRNKKLQTAYCCTSSKEVREVMKEFARENPEKYNYNKAQIPLNTLAPEELAEKKKIQRKIKREKEKIKREENKVKQKEQIEKDRFIHLSDREKRALAAERRILSQDGKVILRCFLCASDISGKVPFEYLGNRFCSIDCLKAHRLKNSTTLS